MALKIVWNSPASNKPPEPQPEPDKAGFPIQLLIEKRKGWVSNPYPDKLAIIGKVLPEQFGSGTGETAPADLAFIVTHYLASGKLGKVIHTRYYMGQYQEVQVQLASCGVAINFTVSKQAKGSPPSRTLRMEFNPTRVGYSAMIDLLDNIHEVTGKTFKVGHFLATSRVNRLDIAVDVVGFAVPELIVTVVGQGKRVHYFGEDGALEAVYVHRKIPKKPPKNPSGLRPLLLKVYDKVRERQAFGVSPPFGPAPVTRIEVERRRFGNKPFLLADIPQLKNPLAAVRVGYTPTACPPGYQWWMEYVEARRGGGPAWAAKLLGLSDSEAEVLNTAFEGHPSNVLPNQALWAHWKHSLEQSGVSLLIDAAEHYSHGSHITDLIGKI